MLAAGARRRRLIFVGLIAPVALSFAVLSGRPDAVSIVKTPITYSPLTAIATGPAGPATALFSVEPYCCPSTAIVATPSGTIGEDDFQFIELGLSVPTHLIVANTLSLPTEIDSVEVCYEIETASPGSTYISQTRLTDMITPAFATVVHDDATDRTAVGPTCYTSAASFGAFSPEGTITLALKVVFGSADDEIRIGMTKLNVSPVAL